jgi:hypothetical protein
VSCEKQDPTGLPDAAKNEGTTMRTIGRRKEPEITFSASAELLAEGARFNDEIHRLPTGSRTFIRKGVYRFQSHAEANRHELDCMVEGMATIAMERS